MRRGNVQRPSNVFRAYAEQTLAMNRMRGMLEDEMTQKRAENKRLALEKK
jgi:hypothetical protein